MTCVGQDLQWYMDLQWYVIQLVYVIIITRPFARCFKSIAKYAWSLVFEYMRRFKFLTNPSRRDE
jgi:hypothetical protein